MHEAPARDEEIVRTARIHEGADDGRNDRQAQVIWAAGLFDGEGHIALAHHAYRAHLRTRRNGIKGGLGFGSIVLCLSVQNTHPGIARLADLFGGRIYRAPARNSRERNKLSWEASSEVAEQALRELLPHLVIKRGEAELALRFQATKRARGRRAIREIEWAELMSFAEAMKQAHHIAWVA